MMCTCTTPACGAMPSRDSVHDCASQAEQSLLPDVAAAVRKADSLLPESERGAAPPKEARAVLSSIPAGVRGPYGCP